VQWDHIASDQNWDGKDKTQKNRQFAIDDRSVPVKVDYDPNSVMHYPAPAQGWQGVPPDQSVSTMLWKADPTKQLGGGATGPSSSNAWKQLTQLDVDGLNILYDNLPGWSYQQQVADVGTTDSPALATFQDGLFLAWKGSSDQHIWWSHFDGSNWSTQQQVPNVGTTNAPALAQFQNQLYLAWKGSSDQHIWWSRFDGANWSAQQQVPNVGTSNAPALAQFQNQLYVAWQGSSDQHIWWSRFDGANWSAQQQVPNVGTSNGPALAQFQNQLYVAWKGSSDQHIWVEPL
jgi:hypothetical protein